MILRRRLGILAGTAWLLLATTVLTATPADARRNVGGSVPADWVCVQPGGIILAEQAMAPCVCYSVPVVGVVKAAGRGGECPRGVDRIKIDRNVGG